MKNKKIAIRGEKGYKCLRCNHIWKPRKVNGKERVPIVCPKCHSPYWNIKKQGKD